ncbi:MAG: hypothetical protein E7171_02145 [Firmicutes bacterium]|jgi:hypothetical protein|nr:hypothetical protein [Bacillota bacterium]
MNSKRHKFKLITGYIAVITIFFVLSIIFYNLLLTTNKYYLFIVIPLLFLSISTSLFNLLKLLFTIVSFMFSKNDNDEVLKSINKRIYEINQLYKYTLIGIFIALLTTVMILDIIVCVTFEKFNLLAISIVIWILLYYSIFYIIVKIVKKQISL